MVAVLAGAVNTRFVAALTTAGVRAVGLTGADGACGLSDGGAAAPHGRRTARSISAASACRPPTPTCGCCTTLTDGGFVPVVACIGLGRDGRLFNVNADTFAGHLAARLGARRLVIAGTTAGVLDADGATLPVLDAGAIARLVDDGTATAGMIAKLRACEHALAGGVDDVVIVDGRDERRSSGGRAIGGSRRRTATAAGRHGRGRMVTAMSDGASTTSQAREARHVLQTYRRQPVTFVRGQGVRLYDAEGREYLDLLSGIGVASLGHAHPRPGARDCGSGARRCSTRRTCSITRCRGSSPSGWRICRACRAPSSATAAPKRSRRA